jgi:hypothetical protein
MCETTFQSFLPNFNTSWHILRENKIPNSDDYDIRDLLQKLKVEFQFME